MALGSTQPVTEPPYHLVVPTVYKLWEPQPSGAQRACPDLQWDSFLLGLSNSLGAEALVL